MTTTQQAAIDLMPQLRDILHLPEELDLPKLYHIGFDAYYDQPGCTVQAQLMWLPTDLARWEACRAWASGGEPTVTPAGSARRQVSVTVKVAEVAVEIWAAVGQDFVPPVAAPVHAVGSFASLLLGGDER